MISEHLRKEVGRRENNEKVLLDVAESDSMRGKYCKGRA